MLSEKEALEKVTVVLTRGDIERISGIPNVVVGLKELWVSENVPNAALIRSIYDIVAEYVQKSLNISFFYAMAQTNASWRRENESTRRKGQEDPEGSHESVRVKTRSKGGRLHSICRRDLS